MWIVPFGDAITNKGYGFGFQRAFAAFAAI